ncbi:MAG: M23 family metallopeptidase [bacterium]|jgi:murein DD-endopeptidase MepM/ murein hydrolase activator NlpD
MADERRLTLIVVPHGDLETRTYEISYRRLRLLLGAAGGLLVLFIIMAASWWYIAAQAARVPALEREVARLEEERRQVAELARALAEAEAQYERVRNLLGATGDAKQPEPVLPPLRQESSLQDAGPQQPSQPDAWPLSEAGYITRRMAAGESNHPGIDIAVPKDSYIRAAGPGVVSAAGTDEVYGQFVLIDHGGGIESMYGHASRLFVAPGDRVERHEVIALSGSTGRSTAPHLHFEVRRNGEAIDPLVMIRQP